MKATIGWQQLVWGVLVIVAANQHGLLADDTEPRSIASAKTREQVQEALQREVYGLSAEREQLLSAAIQAEPESPLPRWYQGQVQAADGQWRSAEKPVPAREGQLYREYVNERNAKGDDAAGQKTLADWCERNGLKQQERAHLLRSLSFNPNQPDLLQRLDLVRVGNQWVEKALLAREQARAKAARAAHEHWQPIVTKLTTQLGVANKEKRQAAIDQVLAIRDPAALPTLQAILGSTGEEQELLMLQVCEKLTDLSSTRWIAYLAAECPSEKVRQQAAQLLKGRALEEYVPMLISEMYTPVQTAVATTVLPNGVVGLRRGFVREGATQFELFVSDAWLDPFSNPLPSRDIAGDTLRGVERAQGEARVATLASEIAVSQQNLNTKARNGRIADALIIATGEKLAANPELWWKWWLDLNELEFVNGKSVDTKYRADVVYVYNPQVFDVVKTYPYIDPNWFRPHSCLNAGTPVWTDQGPVAVERIKIGDLVLSRDVDSGELAYKPVLLTTVRPKRQLTAFTVGDEKLQATGGHLFWSSGKGWVRTRELQPNQVLHTATNPANVYSVEPGIMAETYNLVVADFHTYFVGEQKLLSHDNTPRRPTRMIVPGLAAE